MLIENPMRGYPLLAFRPHRKQSRRFVDHEEGIVKMDYSEAGSLKCRVAPMLPFRNSNYVTRFQLGVMPYPCLVLYRHRPEPQKVLRPFMRQPHRQTD